MKTKFYAVADVTKSTEGGISQKDIKSIANRRGIECRVGPSCYVGKTRVSVRTENSRQLQAFVNEIMC